MLPFKILDETDYSLCLSKPEGYFVHQPENGGFRVPREKLVLQNLRDQLGYKVYPIHRLDSATRGLLLFAKSPESASTLTQSFVSSSEKFYLALCRGWLKDRDCIAIPLQSDSSDELLPCLTYYLTLRQIELPYSVGKRFHSARLSLMLVKIQSGRYHQIRRHFNRISHPIIGDGEHGDSHYNRFFREYSGFPGLNLWAFHLRYDCPFRKQRISLFDTPNERWQYLTRSFFELPIDLKSEQTRSQLNSFTLQT